MEDSLSVLAYSLFECVIDTLPPGLRNIKNIHSMKRGARSIVVQYASMSKAFTTAITFL